ncbi:ferrodoxin [Brachyspira hampsonii]|uniref:Ferrodoxin n=1 Tax=Brachyspira hampsonii TaxID=1287055 RepID=A0AAC9XKM0_9SPIR|nr:2Fe-2S iron-sulfur cluster-binding protein [Brachyspira hampsonii]ASJ21825.1 ferrodoxin [Brachyspira hampsonii]MBW5380457.1 ferrodoxin [Brachyspira hampsonii]MBW5410350.1 ferrodoxin [Brachyspira hampsonii]OEJ17403.1 ferrodoxin [Brachyspira hampsonii]
MIIKFSVDGKTVSSQKGYTILQALSYINIDIPHLCSYKINSTNTFEKKNNILRCKLCLVKVKKKNENSYSYKYACDEIVENGMSVLNEKDDDIINYRTSLLKAILYMHEPVCESCKADYVCNLKKYLDIYNISIEASPNAFDKNDINLIELKNIVEKMNLPDFIKANFERCINCGICEDYKVIDGYNSMITDLCPTHVFDVQRNIDNKINDDISTIKSIDSFCIGCNYLCDAKYSYIKHSIKDISSPKGKKYGLCDYGRKLDYYSNNTLEKPFYNGMQCEFNEAKELYHKFINDIETEYVLALNSSMYPIEDIRAFNEFIDSLGIQNLVFKKNIMATNSKNIRDNYTNINDFSIKEIRDLNINLKHSIFDDNIIHNGKFKKFIIVGDSLDDNDNIIDFSKKNKGNYIVFSPNFSVLAYNAYLSFPISYLGEFEGHYVDNHGKVKEMHSFLEKNKNRMSLRDLLKYLYL